MVYGLKGREHPASLEVPGLLAPGPYCRHLQTLGSCLHPLRLEAAPLNHIKARRYRTGVIVSGYRRSVLGSSWATACLLLLGGALPEVSSVSI